MFSNIDELKSEIDQFENNMKKTDGVINLLENNLQLISQVQEELEKIGNQHVKSVEELNQVKGKIDERHKEILDKVDALNRDVNEQKRVSIQQSENISKRLQQNEIGIEESIRVLKKQQEEKLAEVEKQSRAAVAELDRKVAGEFTQRSATLMAAILETKRKIYLAIEIGVGTLVLVIIGLIMKLL